jgi:FkbM family methyltransferase
MKPRDLLSGIMATIYDRGAKGAPDGKPRDIALGGGLVVNDITGHAAIDPNAVGLILRYLDPGDTMIDVGAHVGIYSALAGAIVGSRGRVEAIEPSPSLRPCLEANLVRNGLPNVRVHAKLAGGRRMQDPFVDGIGRSRRRRVPGRREWVRDQNLLHIPSIRIDEMTVGRRCSLVRIDVAGYELRVLEGAEELLRRPNPPVLLLALDSALADYGHSPRQILAWLAARDYAVCFYDGQRHLMVHSAEPWRLHRVLFAFPVGAHNLVSQRLARRANAA